MVVVVVAVVAAAVVVAVVVVAVAKIEKVHSPEIMYYNHFLYRRCR